MGRFWWVNHKQTVRQEIEGQYLWSPKTSRNGARNEFYDNMRRATPGDLVLSYASQEIRHVGRVAEFAFTAPKPAEFGTTGANWSNVGWLLRVFWTALTPAIHETVVAAATFNYEALAQDLVWEQFGFSEAPMTWNTTAFAAYQRDYLAYRSEVYVA